MTLHTTSSTHVNIARDYLNIPTLLVNESTNFQIHNLNILK